MPVNLALAPGLAVAGVSLSTVAAGIKPDGSNDLVLICLSETNRTAAVFTQNAFCAAPVTLCKEYLRNNQGAVRAMLINAGNANAGTGSPGIDMARGHCQAVAGALSLGAGTVLPFSTGVIGQLLPDEKMRSGISAAARALQDSVVTGSEANSIEAWQSAARGIMTTDTEPKLTSQTVVVNGQTITITGMAKGAGMIQPNMATMLAYVFTDAAVSAADCDNALRSAVDGSFNAITVDSDTSTNDACLLSATGQGVALSSSDVAWPAFLDALTTVCRDLAQAIIRDAEGASKFITVRVTGGRNTNECKTVAYAVANSPLVKTALFASDANVGRLLMAVGKADIDALDPAGVTINLGDLCAFQNGGIAEGYSEKRGAEIMAKSEIDINIDLARGDAVAEVYTSDLSHDYVSINADYRS
ncbi:MAG: bifunctional glutamate N-acetyltransferase/amino-acid acetyltransferase ArgJ [Granulosicoccus sp.]